MSNFRELMKKADMAKKFSIAERDVGYFDILIKEYPNDGMVHLRLGETYEYLNEIEKAKKEYKLAAALFPMPQWKNNAEVSLKRLEEKKQPSKNMSSEKSFELKDFKGFCVSDGNQTSLKDKNNEDVIF